MEEIKTQDECQKTAPIDEAEQERLRREKDAQWEEQEAARREKVIRDRVRSNWRNRWL